MIKNLKQVSDVQKTMVKSDEFNDTIKTIEKEEQVLILLVMKIKI